MRSTAILVLAAAVACSSDGPTPPTSERLASQLDALADSSGEFGPFGFALHSAAAIVEAGGSISKVIIELDGVPEQFDAVAFRVSYTDAACDQLMSGFGGIGMGLDSTVVVDTTVIVEDEWDFLCAPSQSLVAWQGDPVRRIAVVQGDTGSSTIDHDNFSPWTFWASYFDRDDRADWWLHAGSKQASLVSDNGPCRQTPQPGSGMQIDCRLATLSHSFDLSMHQYSWGDGDEVFPVRPVNGVRGGSSIVADTVIYSDTGIVIFPGDSTYTPPEPHTMRMTSRAISGVSMLITHVDVIAFSRRHARAMVVRPGAASR